MTVKYFNNMKNLLFIKNSVFFSGNFKSYIDVIYIIDLFSAFMTFKGSSSLNPDIF